MQKKAVSNILERYVKLAELQLNKSTYTNEDVIKVASVLIEEDILRASLFDKVAQADAMGRSIAHAMLAQLNVKGIK